MCAGAVDIQLFGQSAQYHVAAAAWAHTTTSGASVTLNYDERAYLVPACAAPGGAFSPQMFSQRIPMYNSSWSFTVDLSSASCGCNVGLYASAMPAVGRSGAPDPSTSGDFYCDANNVSGLWCTEMDIMEANVAALATTPHHCEAADAGGFVASCDRGGCSRNSKNTAAQFGPAASFAIDTRRPFTVTAAFPVGPQGELAGVETAVTQSGSAGFSYAHTPQSCGESYFLNVRCLYYNAAPLAALLTGSLLLFLLSSCPADDCADEGWHGADHEHLGRRWLGQ